MSQLFLTILVLVCAAACQRAPADALPPTATTYRVQAGTLVPTVSRDLRQLQEATDSAATAEPLASPQASVEPALCSGTAGQPSVRHDAAATLDYAAKTVSVEQRTRLINRTNEPLATIVFAVEPNRIGGAFALDSVRVGELAPAFEITGRRLAIELAEPLAPGCPLEIDLAFQLTIPAVGTGLASFTGYFAHTDRQINLAHWLPIVAARSGGGWITQDAALVGEQVVAEQADWRVELHLVNAPERVTVAAAGTVEQVDEATYRIEHRAAREVAISLSDRFNMQARMANGTQVELYSFSDTLVQGENGVVDGAAHALEIAARALAMYSDLFGVYGRERFVVVEGDFPDGMELDGLAFVSDDWFRTYRGTPQSYLTLITIHEVAHQWWYARVGSDQAMTPWLDEALATYSEYIFYEEYYPDLRDWWWAFRVGSFVGDDFEGPPVDSTVYQFGTIREYINAVYLRGAQMLHALRRDLGTEAFFDWLARYSTAAAGRIATPDIFWSLLSAEQLAATAETRAAYLSAAALTVSSR